MANRVQLRRDYAVNWCSANPILDQGEPGIEVCSGRMKVGDGTRSWSSLPYMSPGNQGPQGCQGPTGAQGLQGVAGPQGNQGRDGAQGNQGSQGFAGFGYQGPRGYTGPQGSQGAQGTPGCNGGHGSSGPQGAQGYQGAAGAQGSQGAAGAQGSQGAAGAQGGVGTTGSQGAQGAQGAVSGVVYMLIGSASSNLSATITIGPGQYQLVLDTRASISDPGDYNFNVTQTASISGSGVSASVGTIINLLRSGGAGFGRNIFGTNVGVTAGFTVGSNTTVTLTVNAPSLGHPNAALQGSILSLIKN